MVNFFEQKITVDKLEITLNKIKEMVYVKTNDLDVKYGFSNEPVDFNDRLNLEYKNLEKGEKWGGLWDCAWFHITGKTSELCKGKKTVLIIDINGEGCIYDNEGTPVRGITNVNSEFDKIYGLPGKRVVQFADKSSGNEEVDLWIDAGCNDLFGKYSGGTLVQADVAICDDEIRSLYYDYWVLLDLLKVLNKDTSRYSGILYTLNEVADYINSFNEEEIKHCRKILNKQLEMKAGDNGLVFYAVGHAHLDLAWLWPIRETKRKALRTFSTAVENLNRYPDYIFGASQPQQFEWTKNNAPKLYDKIKSKVAENRIELQGAMWVEPDLNLTGGESLVRQIIYGKKFWKDEFGKEIKIAHLPDVFGFNGNLPQILKKSGVDYLLTIKLSWNKYNKFPYQTFNWKGIDGTEVLVHMPPEGTYNSAIAPRSVVDAETNFNQKGISGEAVILYGIGDGGGGPGTEHLERLKRIKDLNGISKVKSSSTEEFFEIINKEKEKFHTYSGELYLEKHQGTYTTQAKNKYYNRKIEILLKDAELFCTMAYKLKGMPYPKKRLDNIWKEVLLYQFHDILPGSSIKRVYDESVERYKTLINELEEIINAALSVFNSEKGIYNPSSAVLSVISERNNIITVQKLNPFSSEIIFEEETSAAQINANIMENKFISIEFNENGEIVNLFDKAKKRAIFNKTSNILSVYEDSGDAWDMDEGYLNRPRGKFTLKSFNTFSENGYTVRENIYEYGNSVLKQRIKMNGVDRAVYFENQADWQESGKFLKAELYPEIFTDEINCNIQFGNIKRSLKKNNSFELAQDEICAHKYIDFSESNYGFAVFNDCKYGYNAEVNSLKISLLRSPNYPGENADQGEHRFNYAFYLHDGNFENSDVSEKALAYNNTAYNVDLEKFVDFKSDSCIIESIKPSENEDGIVIRVAEEKGKYSTFNLKANFRYDKMYESTLDEKIICEISEDEIQVKPFEIKTLIYK